MDAVDSAGTGPSPERPLRERAYEALRAVVDPEMGLNVVDLGLVRQLEERQGRVALDYQLTSPNCPIGGMLATAMGEVLDALPGVRDVELNLVEEPPWGPWLISPEGRRALGLE